MLLILWKMWPKVEIFKTSVEKLGEQGGLELLNRVKTQMGRGQSRNRNRVMQDPDH